MATVSRSTGKRVSPQTQIWSWKSTPSASVPLFRRNGHSSAPEMNLEDVATVYEKNPDDPIPENVVPDEVIRIQSEEYWVPHPQTKVFVPPSDCDPSEDVPEPEESCWSKRPGNAQLISKIWRKPISLQVEVSETSETATREVAG